MKILLVNPNRYRTPPVPPLALEYLHAAIARTRHESRVLDLCFSRDVLADVRAAIDRFSPHIAGVTVRNVDTVLMENNEFFLDEIRELVRFLRSLGIPVAAGGVGFSFMPDEVRDYLGADYGILGPGEKALPLLLDQLERRAIPRGTILNGWECGIDADAPTEREIVVDHAVYLQEGGLLGFETQKGCLARCSYCGEGRGQVLFKAPQRVVEELRGLAQGGFRDFHLCDAEFNQDLEHCYAFLEALLRADVELRWTAYLKTEPYAARLFELLHASGVHLITVSHPTGDRGLDHLQEIRRLTAKQGIRLAVDYLCGLPGDTLESVRSTIARLRSLEPDTVGVNSALRLYPQLPVTGRILSDPASSAHIDDRAKGLPGCVRPVFFRQLTAEQLREIIGADPRFRIEGFERTTNYQRLPR